MASAGYYEANRDFKYLLPADVLKYFSLLIASSRDSHISVYTILKGIKGRIETVKSELCCLCLFSRSRNHGKIKEKAGSQESCFSNFDHEMYLKKLSKRLKNVRKQNGFKSYELFACDIEISRTGLSKYESGAFDDIRMRTLIKIIDGLGMTPKEFFSEGFD